MRLLHVMALSAVALIAAGCQPSTMYYWGSYQDLVYVGFAEPGKLPPQEQIKVMEGDLQAAQKAHKPMPPGFHAHLGYLYAAVGNKDAARSNFEEEKRKFPESAVLMDRLLGNLSRS